jgi:hypothetical protein
LGLRPELVKVIRYRTWRRSITLGAALMMLSFVVPIFWGEEWIRTACDILFWTSLLGSVGFQLAIAVLRRLGIFEFSYTEADRNSYLYNMESMHRQMRDFRRGKKRD